MLNPDEILRRVNGIKESNPEAAIVSLRQHLAELASVCIHQGAAIRELQKLVSDLQARPEIKTKPF